MYSPVFECIYLGRMEAKEKGPTKKAGPWRGSEGTRTPDAADMSRLLYHLSYTAP